MLNAVVLLVMLLCGLQAVRASRLIYSTLWLAGASAMMATLLYAFGAYVAAVIELSVGAGLVTVLFVLAISLIGDEVVPERSPVPKALAAVLITTFAALLILFSLPLAQSGAIATGSTFTEVFWHERSADTVVQIALIFTCALSVLGLLVERRGAEKPAAVALPEAALREGHRP